MLAPGQGASQDGTDVCLAQIQAGLAWHFKRYELQQTPDERAAYAAAEVIAKAARRGLCGVVSHQRPRGSFEQAPSRM